MRCFFVLLTLFFTSQAITQQRVGININYRQSSFSGGVEYHKVIIKQLFFTGRISGGKNGFHYNSDVLPLYSETVPAEASIYSPWTSVNPSIETDDGTVYLKGLSVYNYSINAQLGLGYFFNFTIDHGLRVHLTATFGNAFSKVIGYYSSYPPFEYRSPTKQANHLIFALGPEIYHTIRTYQKFTFNYGARFPYYFLIQKEKFNPTHKEYNYYRWMPEISIGMTYLFGDC